MKTSFKKLIAIIVAVLFTIPFLPFRGAAIVEDDSSVCTFYAPALEKMIHNNLSTQSADTVFSNTLANAYLADCEKLFDILSDLSFEDLLFVAKAIAYDLFVTERIPDAIQPGIYAGTDYFVIAAVIYDEVQNPANANFADTMVEQEPLVTQIQLSPSAAPMTDESIIDISLSISDNDIDIYDTLTVNVSFITNLVGTSNRGYNVELYITNGTTTTLLRRGLATIPSGQVQTTVTLRSAINVVGQYSVYAKVVSPSTGVTATSSTYTIISRGKWHIDVALPVNRNNFGTLTLYDATGTQILQDICLGKSANGTSMYTEFGNTPTGEYTGYLGGPEQQTSSYGPYKVIKTTPVSGIIVDSGRYGIWIHGGNPNPDPNSPHYPLRVTEGCVRITNDTQLALQNSITNLVQNMYHYNVGTISMYETS